MSAHKHTPGPWKVGQPYGCSIYDNNGKRVAKCFEVWTSPLRPLTECKANGRLISAAPELLEALKNLRDAEWMVTHEWGGDRKAALDAADAAIAKATGEPA